MDGHTGYNAKGSKPEKDKYHMILFVCGIWGKKKRYRCTYVANRHGLINIENKWMVNKKIRDAEG